MACGKACLPSDLLNGIRMSTQTETDLSARLGAGQYDDAELVHCINEFFPKYRVQGDEVIYAQGDEADWEIKLLYKKDRLGAIVGRIDSDQISRLESRHSRQMEVGLVLNLLFEFGVQIPMNGGATWVIRPTRNSEHPTVVSELLQSGYIVDGVAGQLPSFFDTAPLSPLNQTQPKQYYSQLGIPSGRSLEAATDTIGLAQNVAAPGRNL